MLPTKKFTVQTRDLFGLLIPEAIAAPIYSEGHKRIFAKAFYKLNSIEFHVALRKLHGHFVIYFGKRLIKELNLELNEPFELQFFEDTSKYGVEMPKAFEEVLDSDWEAKEFFERLTDGKKRGLIYHILRYKNVQTQIDKTLIISENLKMGINDTKLLVKSIR